MKVLVFGDSHGSTKAFKELKAKAKKADLLVCIGDITVFEQNFSGIMKQFDKLGKKMFIINGNHEEEHTMRKQCKDTKNIQFIHEKVVEFNGFRFVGYGGGGFSLTDPWMKNYFNSVKARLKDQKIIFITHAPPHKTKLDDVHGASCGCKTVRWVIEKFKPKYAFSGHLHENFGKKDKIGSCQLENPGPFGVLINLSEKD